MPRKILSQVGFDATVDSLVERTESDNLAKEVNNKEKQKKTMEGIICKQRESVRMMYAQLKQKRVWKTIEKLQKMEDELMQDVGEIYPGENPRDKQAAENVESSELVGFGTAVEEKENRVRMARLHSAALLEKLQIVSKVAARAERRAKEWEQVLQEEEQMSKEMESRHCQHQEALSGKTQELQCLKSRENVLLANISAGQATITGLQKQQSENEQVLVKKKELAHDQEVRMAAVERKVQALSEEEERMKERKTLQEEESELAKTLREKKEIAYRLRKQQKNTEMELRSGRRAVEKTADVHRDLSFQVEEMQLETDASVRELQRLSTEKQGALRRETALRRDVKRASGRAQSEADRLVAAETRRLQLELAVKELEVENAFKREMHLAKMVISRQGPKKLRAEVNQKLRRAETLRRKYETTAASSLRFQGGDRTPQPHMGRTCEDAGLQGRLELWTRRVSGKQEEVKVLKSTLHAHRSRNAEPRPSPGPTPRSGKDPGEQKLAEEKKALEETCSAKRRKILELQHDIKGQKTALDKLLREEAVAEAGLWVQSLTEQLGSQEAKLDQAHQQSSELTLEAQTASKTQEKTKEDEMEDIKLSELLDFSREVDLMLLAVMDEQTDLGSVLQAQFQQSDLSLPTPATPPATGRGQTPTCTSPRSTASRGSSETLAPSSRREDSDSSDLTLKLAVTRVLLCATLLPDSPQGSPPCSHGNGSSPPTPRCPPNSPVDKPQSPHPSERDGQTRPLLEETSQLTNYSIKGEQLTINNINKNY